MAEKFDREFLIFAIKRILETSSLMIRQPDGRYALKENIAGVDKGEFFTDSDSCAKAILASLQNLYGSKAA